jgi:D-3-phosphoglycerate dehydrogenase
MNRRVLVSAPYFQPVVERFRSEFEERGLEIVIPAVHERLTEEELLQLVGDIDGTICGDDAYTDRVLDAAPRLRVISKWGTGIDSIDRESCEKRGIAVCNTPNAFSDPVADTTLGYLLSFARNLHSMTAAMRAGKWVKLSSRTLKESTVGLIGMGNIGQTVARRLSGFGGHMLGNDPVTPPASFLSEFNVEMVKLDQMLAESDFISLHCDLNPSSFHIINAAALEKMKPEAFLVNTARGKLVDEAALVQALLAGKIAGAAMDVFEVEPLPLDSPLLRMSNVLMAAHNSNSSPVAWERVHRNTVDNLFRHLGVS